MEKTLLGIIDKFHRPYTLSENELLSLCKADTNKPNPVDVKKLVSKAKLANSDSSDLNMKVWMNFVAERLVPNLDANENYKSEPVEAFAALMCIGIFHNEKMIDSAEYTEDDLYNSSLIYASKLMCPENALESMMREKTPIEEIMKTFKAPKICVMTAIGNILKKNGYSEVDS